MQAHHAELRRRRAIIRCRDARALRHVAEHAVTSEKRARLVEFGNLALAESHDAIRVHDGVQPVRNREDRARLELLADLRLDERVRFVVDGSCRLVEQEDLWLAEDTINTPRSVAKEFRRGITARTSSWF